MKGKQYITHKDEAAALLFLSVSFLLGSFLGFLAAHYVLANDLLQMFWQERENFAPPTLCRAAWIILRWPAAVLLLRMLPAVGITVPGLFLLRGFFFSYNAAAMAGCGMGISGAAVLLGTDCLLSIPVLFLLGTETLLSKTEKSQTARYFALKALLCLFPLALCIFLESYAVPLLLKLY